LHLRGDVDDRGTIAVAVPWHDAAGLDRELAEPQLAVLDVCRFLLEVDSGEHRIGDTLGRLSIRRARVDFHLVRRALAGDGRRQARERGTPYHTRENQASAEALTGDDAIEHFRSLLCYAPAVGRP